MNVFIPPLKIYLCWFENRGGDSVCKQIALELFEFLHRPIDDNFVLRPGLEIPTEFGRDLGHLLDSLDRGTESDARVRVVVSLLDAVAHDNDAHRQVVGRSRDRWLGPRDNEVHIPIRLDASFAEAGQLSHLDPALTELGLDSEIAAHPQRKWKLGSAVAIIAGRILRSKLNEAHPPNPTIFFSNDEHGAARALELTKHFETETPITVCPRAPEGDSSSLTAELRAAGGDAVLLVVRTDSYAESDRCALELLVAKQTHTSILTVMATSDGELRAPAYGGNHRTVNWQPGREWEVAGRSVQAWLHAHHFDAHARAAMTRAGLPAYSQVVARRPELLDLFGVDTNPASQLMIHPDPPLTTAEVDLLRRARPAARFATPSTLLGRVLLANDPLPPLAGTTIGLSLSVAEDVPTVEQGHVGTGLTQHHVNDAIKTLVLATLHSGARIAYGGDLRRDSGYAKLLSDLHESRRRLGTGATSQLLCFVDATTLTRPGDAADEIEFEREKVETPADFQQFEQLSSQLWHLAMRDLMAQRCQAQVLLGGKLRPSLEQEESGYSGAWPGLLEEALRTLERGAALYLVGGFGGAAGVVASMLATGAVPKELTRAQLQHPTLEARVRELTSARNALVTQGVDPRVLLVDGTTPLDIESIAERVLERWQRFSAVPDEPDKSAWNNGLTVAENQRLFRSTDPTEITHLVFEGIRRLTAQGVPQIALYHGDISSVPDVGAYAVTITPGLPPIGASRAIDTKAGRVIATHTWSDDQSVAVLPLATPDLSGRHAIVLRLPLSAPGVNISASEVQDLAKLAATEADQLGIASIALVPFGTTLGLALAESARAIEAGFRTGGNLNKTLVFCETDRARYQELLSVFQGCTELRAGPRPAPTATGAVLQIAVEAPTAEEPRRKLRSTLYAASNLGPVIPQHEADLTRPLWLRLRDPYVDFEDTSQTGQLLWDLVLSEQMQEQLATQTDQRLVVIGDPTASSIPWELLTGPQDQSPACSAGLVRRIALSGHVSALAPEPGLGARLRVLIVVNADGLLSVEPERREIEAALQGYADVFIEVLENATQEQLKDKLGEGHFDVLHYAGHASFDEATPSKTGLHLADGVFSGEDLAGIKSPRLVFLSACESGRVLAEQRKSPKPGEESALAEAFLRQGVKALLGTFFAVNDGAAQAFAAGVYRSLASGATLGTAVQQARRKLFDASDRDWANFLLYGNDSLVL